jgi:hypothetical protein
MIRRSLLLAAALGRCIGLASAATHAPLSVTATVAPSASLMLLSQPPEIAVSTADVVRGYVDVDLPSAVRVQSNSPRGYELEVLALSPFFSALAIHGLEQDVTLGAEGGSVIQRWQHGQTVSLALTWRFYLAREVVPGQYSWPLRLSVRPLAMGQ